MSQETRTYKLFALQAARDLCYPAKVISALKAAQSESEICRIMTTARKES